MKISMLLRAPFRAWTWVELAYLLISLPLAVLGFGYLVVTLVSGAALSVTVIGLPLLAAGLIGAGRLGGWHRTLARRLLGLTVPAPSSPPPAPGLRGWIKSALGNPVDWRAMAYLFSKLPVAVLSIVLSLGCWAYGVLFVAYPYFFHTGANLDDGPLSLWGFALDTWPRALLTSGFGLALLFAAPWVTHGVLMLDCWLIRGLLGPTATAERLRDLATSRAHAVDDSAAKLRQIERDLHDGAQAKLVALAMKLGLAREELADADPAALERARTLLDTAHRGAKEAIAELRDLAQGIHPPALDQGLEPALATLAAQSAVPVRLQVDVPVRPAPAIETIAYFCTAELLTNVAKHSGARQAAVVVAQQGDMLRLMVEDDGSGGAALGRGSGLAGLTDRTRTVDGRLTINSPPGGPTTVTIDLPTHT